jgi:hypothetical protein
MLGVLALGSVVVGEFRTVSVTPVIAHERPLPDPPASVPLRSVSVPVLLLPDGAALHVGDSAADAQACLHGANETAAAGIERTTAGERVTRFYEVDGRRFAVVLEPLGGDAQVRVAGIYLN